MKAAGRKPRDPRDGASEHCRADARDARRVPLAIEPRTDGQPCPSCCSPTTRPTPSGSSARRHASPYVKDAFHDYVVDGRARRGEPGRSAPRRRPHYRSTSPPAGEARGLRLRLSAVDERRRRALRDRVRPGLRAAHREADAFYDAAHRPRSVTADERASSARRTPGCSGSKQFYHYVVADWLDGDPASRRRRPSVATGATPTGGTSTTATSSRCRTSGSTPGTPRGTSPST